MATATAPAVPPQWIHEDDLVLKNALEAGASLEALAKGAVQFSRRVTLRELRERWHSLLYDPSVSAQASPHMFELEIFSGVNPASKLNRSENNVKGNKEISQKRKSESIRSKYYTMRKKNRREMACNTGLVFLEPNPQDFNGNVADFQKQVSFEGNPLGQNSMLGDSISELLELREEDLVFLHACCSDPLEDGRNGRIGSYGFDENFSSLLTQGGNSMLEANLENQENLPCESSAMNQIPQSSTVGFEDGQIIFSCPNSDDFSSFKTSMPTPEQPHLHHWNTMQDVSGTLVPVDSSMGDEVQVAESMHHNIEVNGNGMATSIGDYSNHEVLKKIEDVLLSDENDGEANSDVNNTESSLLDFQKDGEKNDIGQAESENMAVAGPISGCLSSRNLVVFEVHVPSFHEDQQTNPYPEVKLAPPELSGGKIICTLNTEDPEIPCNDDIFMLTHNSPSLDDSATETNTTVPVDAPTAAAQENNIDQVVSYPEKTKDSMKPSGWPQRGRTQGLPEPHSVHSPLLIGQAAKVELHDSRPEALIPVIPNKTIRDSSKGKSPLVIPKPSSDRLVQKDDAGFATRVGDSPATLNEMTKFTEASSGRMIPPEPVVDSSVSDQEESQIDDDVPYFSDVEAMILEMDLDPYDQDSQVTRQVPSYQYDDSKRTIIRLEQGARSSLERAMTSHGAFAIIYGRRLRQYIRKPEVLLGRSTYDVDVDIDLQREGRANKISRRQAIIKMEADGSFTIKNLGRSSLFVNGISVATGQLLTLGSSCLIEIREMSFVFEINEKYVRKHLRDIFKENTGSIGNH